MNRTLGITLLILDFLVMGLSGYLVIERIRINFNVKKTVYVPLSETVPVTDVSSASQKEISSLPDKTSAKQTEASLTPPSPVKKHTGIPKKVSFHYRDAVPKRVSIIGEFNQWSPQLMKKDQNQTWSISLDIEPGEYAYNFVVDGKVIRDPSNPKKKNAGQKIPSSVLTVKK